LISVLCLNVGRLCVPNIMSLGACLKKFTSLMLARAYSVKIGVIFGVRFVRRKVDKNANLHEN